MSGRLQRAAARNIVMNRAVEEHAAEVQKELARLNAVVHDAVDTLIASTLAAQIAYSDHLNGSPLDLDAVEHMAGDAFRAASTTDEVVLCMAQVVDYCRARARAPAYRTAGHTAQKMAIDLRQTCRDAMNSADLLSTKYDAVRATAQQSNGSEG